MIHLHNKQIIIDDQETLILSGEIHYFRLHPNEWANRLDKLRQTGCNTVSTYIPWLCHEPVRGEIDLSGKNRPELDLAAFMDLCRDKGFWFIARPGPFVMAELKNEGLPYWLYDEYPEIIPTGWDNKPATTRTVDYLAPRFLAAVKNWYDAVLPLIAERLQPRGGSVIALQLDNEIGMLSWCSNTPDLTDHLLDDCVAWLKRRYDGKTLQQRYPFSLDIPLRYRAALRAPQESWSLRWLRDLGHYMRDRHARYVACLRNYAEQAGIRDIPFFVNIHGTGGGRGLSYPIGISQLYPAYTQGEGYLAGTDYYLGNLTGDNFQDLHLCNAYTEASQRPDQALCSLEFECGDGDYGNMQANRYQPEALALKLKLCLAQGYRLINFYLFTGGYNYLYEPTPHDGDDRIAITGECHGVAAPIKADGRLSYTFPSMVQAVQEARQNAAHWARCHEERDALTTAFIPDYYLTEFCYPGSQRQRSLMDNLQANRSYGAWESLLRGLLLSGYRFGATDIQNQPATAWQNQVLILPSARYMDTGLQQKLTGWLEAGGRLLLYGEVPLYDMEGEPCRILATALGVIPGAIRQSGQGVYLSLTAEHWASPRAEVRTHFAQTFTGERIVPVLRLHDSGDITAFETEVGQGRAIVIATAYPCDVDFFKTAVERLGVTPALRHDCSEGGIFMTTTLDPQNTRYLHLINLDGFDKTFQVWWQGTLLGNDEPFRLPSRGCCSYRIE